MTLVSVLDASTLLTSPLWNVGEMVASGLASRILADKECCIGETKVLTQLSMVFKVVLAESPAYYRISALGAQGFLCPKTVWNWQYCMFYCWKRQKRRGRLSVPIDPRDSHVFPADAPYQRGTIFTSRKKRSTDTFSPCQLSCLCSLYGTALFLWWW